MNRSVTRYISKAAFGLAKFIHSPAAVAVCALVFCVAMQATALASAGPYSDTAGIGSAISSGTGSGQEAAGALDALRRFWALPVLAAITGVAVIVGVIGLLFRGDKKELFEKLFTYGGIGFLGSAFSSLVVVAMAAYATHVQGVVIH